MIEKLDSEDIKNKIPDRFDKWKDTVDVPPPDYTEIVPSNEDKERMQEVFNKGFEKGIEKAKLTADEVNRLSADTLAYTKGVVSEVKNNLKEKTPDFDFKKIGESALNGAVFGGASGAVLGAIAGGAGGIPGGIAGAGLGAISGVTGEIAKQVAVHNGASDGLANGIKIGIELATGAVLAKVAQKTAEGLYIGGKEIAGQAMETKGGEVIAKQYDDIARFSQDKIKTMGYEAKGLVKNLQTHAFVDGTGKPFMAKLDDVIDFSRTIKMPYIGSHMDNANSAGFLRDKNMFAKEYLKEFPETLSANNIERIKNNLSPIVDKQWIKFNPNNKTFIGERLEHHHINNTDLAAYIPTSLHRGKINKEIMHVDNMALGKELFNSATNFVPGRS